MHYVIIVGCVLPELSQKACSPEDHVSIHSYTAYMMHEEETKENRHEGKLQKGTLNI